MMEKVNLSVDIDKIALEPNRGPRVGKLPLLLPKPQSPDSSAPDASDKGGDNLTLWQFLLELLLSGQHARSIQWTNSDGEFKLLDAEDVARLWGLRKNKNNMTYDKLSRAIRYYYDKHIIRKVNGQKFVYRFGTFPDMVDAESTVPFREKIKHLLKNSLVSNTLGQSQNNATAVSSSNDLQWHLSVPNNAQTSSCSEQATQAKPLGLAELARLLHSAHPVSLTDSMILAVRETLFPEVNQASKPAVESPVVPMPANGNARKRKAGAALRFIDCTAKLMKQGKDKAKKEMDSLGSAAVSLPFSQYASKSGVPRNAATNSATPDADLNVQEFSAFDTSSNMHHSNAVSMGTVLVPSEVHHFETSSINLPINVMSPPSSPVDSEISDKVFSDAECEDIAGIFSSSNKANKPDPLVLSPGAIISEAPLSSFLLNMPPFLSSPMFTPLRPHVPSISSLWSPVNLNTPSPGLPPLSSGMQSSLFQFPGSCALPVSPLVSKAPSISNCLSPSPLATSTSTK